MLFDLTLIRSRATINGKECKHMIMLIFIAGVVAAVALVRVYAV